MNLVFSERKVGFACHGVTSAQHLQHATEKSCQYHVKSKHESLAAPLIIDGWTAGTVLAAPFVVGGSAWLGNKIANALPAASSASVGLAAGGMASASTDHRFLSRPWEDASIYGTGRNNMTMAKKKDDDCPDDLPPLTGKSLNAGKKSLDKVGLKEQKGQRNRGGRAWFDKKGRMRAAFDFAGKIWGEHWHKWNTRGKPTDDFGNVVEKTDAEAHIPVQGNSVKKRR